MTDFKEFFDYFAGSGFPITLTVMIMLAVFVFIVLMLYIPVLTRKIFPRFGYAKYSNYLPFDTSKCGYAKLILFFLKIDNAILLASLLACQ